MESIWKSWVHLNTLSQADILRGVLQHVKRNAGIKVSTLTLLWRGIGKNLENSESVRFLKRFRKQ